MVKLKDIAEKTGYSITTVSRALAGYKDVNERTREQIVKIAYGMGYQPNMVARQLRNQKTDTLGMIIPASENQLSDAFFSELLMGAGHAAAEHGYDLLVSAQTSDNEMDAYRRIVGGNRVDGVLLARTHRHDERIAYLKALNHPFVVAGRSAPDEPSDFPYIDVDSQSGIRMMVEHLTALGHREIAIILPPDDLAFTPYRLAGYREGLESAAIPWRDDYITHGDLRRTGGYQATQRLLARHPHLTAIVACNDLMALGAISALQEMGITVGEQIAVTGFDDITAAEYAHPPLTTVHQPIHAIGRRLVEMLIGFINGAPPEDTQILLSPDLIVRDSCGASARLQPGDHAAHSHNKGGDADHT